MGPPADTQSKRRHRYLAANALCRALVEDGTLAQNPCDAIKMPIELISPQPTLSDRDYLALLGTCELRDVVGKRDKAILTVLASTGCRVTELASMAAADVDLAERQILIRNPKRDRYGRARQRYVFLDDEATKALASWMRVRERVALGPGLWTHQNGRPFVSNGIQQMIKRRGERLGIVVSAHQFRRRLATNWLLSGYSEAGLMAMGGWRSSIMPARYAAAGLTEIARADHARLFGNGHRERDGRLSDRLPGTS